MLVLHILLTALTTWVAHDPELPCARAEVCDFTDEEILEAWGNPGFFFYGPVRPSPRCKQQVIRPTDWLVIDPRQSDAGPMRRWDWFLTWHILADGARPPEPDERGPFDVDARWERALLPAVGQLQGEFAYTRVTVDEPGVFMAWLPGADAIFINGDAFMGDPQRRGYGGVPIALNAGDNDVYVAGIQDSFELELREPASRIVIATWDVWYPRQAPPNARTECVDDILIPLFNASLRPVEDLHYHYRSAVSDEPGIIPGLGDWACQGDLPPLGLFMKHTYLFDLAEEVWKGDVGRMALCTYENGDKSADRKILRLTFNGPRSEYRTRWPVPWQTLASTLMRPTYVVYGTQGADGMADASLAVARYLQQFLWYHADVIPVLVPDTTFLDWHDGRSDNTSVILIGNPRSNSAWPAMKKHLPGYAAYVKLYAQPVSDRGISGIIHARSPRQLRALYSSWLSGRGSHDNELEVRIPHIPEFDDAK